MNIGERIKQRRLELGLTVEDIAQRLGKNRATIYRYENNDIENLPTSVLEPLAEILETTPAYLMGWISEESDSPEDLGHLEMFAYRRIGIEYISKFLDFDCQNIVTMLGQLSRSGKKEAEKRIYELSLIPQYVSSNEEKVYDFSDIVGFDKNGEYEFDKYGNALNTTRKHTNKISSSDDNP